jgi:ABC-type antimicrobial peptide transport system permease subunit
VVNHAFVKRLMPDDPDPVGAHIEEADRSHLTIVGVVKTVAQKGWSTSFSPIAEVPEVYIPASQLSEGSIVLIHTWFSPSFVVRTRSYISGLPKILDQAIASVDPRLPFSRFQNMDEVRGASLSEQRYMAVLFSTLAGLALLLAAVGIYGLIAQSVTERTREMGIRLALGASPTGIVRKAAVPGIALTAAGVAGGLFLSLIAGRLLAGLIYGISRTDPLTYVAVGILLIAVASLSSFLPALRLARLDPVQTLREE